MAYVMNCLENQVSTQAQGKWFTFKPREIKIFHVPEIARFLGQLRGDEGLVEIPDEVMEKDKQDPDRIQFLEDRRREGIHKRIQKLEWQKHNLMSSLRLDLEIKGMKVDPLILASKGDVAALRELNKITGDVATQELSNADIIRKELGLGDPHSTQPGTSDSRRQGVVEPTKTGKQ